MFSCPGAKSCAGDVFAEKREREHFITLWHQRAAGEGRREGAFWACPSVNTASEKLTRSSGSADIWVGILSLHQGATSMLPRQQTCVAPDTTGVCALSGVHAGKKGV